MKYNAISLQNIALESFVTHDNVIFNGSIDIHPVYSKFSLSPFKVQASKDNQKKAIATRTRMTTRSEARAQAQAKKKRQLSTVYEGDSKGMESDEPKKQRRRLSKKK